MSKQDLPLSKGCGGHFLPSTVASEFKIPPLKHIVESIPESGTLSVVEDSMLEHYNVHIGTSHCRSSRRMETRTKDTVQRLY